MILTKDADFSHRIAISEPPPWVLHVRVGNLPLKEFIDLLRKSWPKIECHFPEAKLIDLYRERINVVI